MRRAAAAISALFFAVFARAGGGAALFEAHGCASCHRVGARGGDSGPDLTLAGVRRPRAWLDAWLHSPRGWKRGTLMPEQGLSAGDRAALAAFLSEQRGGAWEGRRPWEALDGREKGRAIYRRAGCVACHGPAGRGGQPNPGAPGGVIPALAPLLGTYTAGELKARIERGAASAGASVVMPAWKGILNEGELDALADYLLSLAEPQLKSDW